MKNSTIIITTMAASMKLILEIKEMGLHPDRFWKMLVAGDRTLKRKRKMGILNSSLRDLIDMDSWGMDKIQGATTSTDLLWCPKVWALIYSFDWLLVAPNIRWSCQRAVSSSPLEAILMGSWVSMTATYNSQRHLSWCRSSKQLELR